MFILYTCSPCNKLFGLSENTEPETNNNYIHNLVNHLNHKFSYTKLLKFCQGRIYVPDFVEKHPLKKLKSLSNL